MKRDGWKVRHFPQMTIIHHAGKGGVRPRMVAQDAFSRKQYAHKHFGAAHRGLYLSALGVRHLIRASGVGADSATAGARREAARRALMTLAGRADPPFGTPPSTAIEPSLARERPTPADRSPADRSPADSPPIETPTPVHG